jgi:hypothetical protein
VAGRDITEGRATRAIAVDVGVVSTSAIWQNTDVAYDVAVGGMPFIYAMMHVLISDRLHRSVRNSLTIRLNQVSNHLLVGGFVVRCPFMVETVLLSLTQHRHQHAHLTTIASLIARV